MATVTVSFGSDTKQDNAITAGWIHSAMEAQEHAGQPICATVRVQSGGIDLSLPVGSCPRGSGGSHPLTAAENDVIEPHRRRHLDQARFSPGELRGVRQTGDADVGDTYAGVTHGVRREAIGPTIANSRMSASSRRSMAFANAASVACSIWSGESAATGSRKPLSQAGSLMCAAYPVHKPSTGTRHQTYLPAPPGVAGSGRRLSSSREPRDDYRDHRVSARQSTKGRSSTM